MQPLIYFIPFICLESFTKARIEKFYDPKQNLDLENQLMNLKINLNDYESNLQALFPPKSYQIKKLTKNETKHIQNKNVDDIQKYLKYVISKKRDYILKTLNFYDIYFKNNSCDPLRIIEQYTNKMGLYFNKTFHEDDAINDIDKQFVMLDITESSNNLLHKAQLSVLHNITKRNNYANNVMNKFYSMLDDLQKDLKTGKEEEMRYICDKFEICRVFPAFSDHISDFLGEIINFSDNTINDIYIMAKVLIKEKINYFNTFLDDDLVNDIGDKLYSMFEGRVSELREVFSVLRKILSKRHKFSVRKNIDQSIRAKAIRILIDIVDKTFEKDDDEVFLIYIGITNQRLRKFSTMTEDQMSKFVGDFIRFIINTLKYNWTPDCKREIRTLLEVLMRKNISDEEVYEYLFTKGSQYVNTKKFTDMDIMEI